jgi:hypothetical protein
MKKKEKKISDGRAVQCCVCVLFLYFWSWYKDGRSVGFFSLCLTQSSFSLSGNMTVVYIEKFNGQHGYKVAHTTTTGAAAGWPRHHQTAAAVITFDGNGALILRLGTTTTHTHTHTHTGKSQAEANIIYIYKPDQSPTKHSTLV